MLKVDAYDSTQVDKIADTVHRDGFAVVKNALTPQQLAFAQAGAARIIKEQTDADPERKGNRGSYRYSFGNQVFHPEWSMLIDLPTIIPSIDKIFGSTDYTCPGAGGDYSLPKAQTQGLHKDCGDFFNDPHKVVTTHDGPAHFIVVNFLMVDFNKEVGAIRFIPCTQRSRHAIPSVDDEPTWMRESIICAPAGTAIIRDVRCWHAGTANVSQTIRPMTSVAYYAPWFRSGAERTLPTDLYNKLTPHGQKICKDIVKA